MVVSFFLSFFLSFFRSFFLSFVVVVVVVVVLLRIYWHKLHFICGLKVCKIIPQIHCLRWFGQLPLNVTQTLRTHNQSGMSLFFRISVTSRSYCSGAKWRTILKLARAREIFFFQPRVPFIRDFCWRNSEKRVQQPYWTWRAKESRGGFGKIVDFGLNVAAILRSHFKVGEELARFILLFDVSCNCSIFYWF